MKKSMNKYYKSSLFLIVIGTTLSTQTPPFYADIIILSIALIYALLGHKQSRE
ncbi:hypothetical protein AAEU28_15375 [Pseudoalteromonas sp. SS15]|uniref:hypothetical protein n=1 Tax=Pseudoalteromonas sp. SS15 TaxID=3139393 RepID=UPI003BA8D5D7